MHVNDGFAPSVLVAEALEPLTYCFGATMAVRRDVLERAGGLAALGDHLGDDYLLGQAVVRAGYRVELASYIVQTAVDDLAFGSIWRRELRWARTISAVRPAGFAASGITHALPFSLAFAAVSRTPVSLGTAALAAVLRVLLHYESGKTFAPDVARSPLLIPFRDVLSFAVWAASFFGRRVEWRSHGYEVEAGGRMADGAGRSVMIR
jgi:ceramide glucosyltransferase